MGNEGIGVVLRDPGVSGREGRGVTGGDDGEEFIGVVVETEGTRGEVGVL